MKLFLALVIGALGLFSAQPGAQPSAKEVPIAQLPKEARETLELVKRGGPFPYRQDRSVFGNRERLLPPRARGYYREYTVPTPGARDRGARRIVAGMEQQNTMGTPREYWYTDDHYKSFKRIKE